jgi:hypothetical protein
MPVEISDLSMGGTESRKSALRWPGERTEDALFPPRKKPWEEPSSAQKVALAAFISQCKENGELFLDASDFQFLPCSNSNITRFSVKGFTKITAVRLKIEPFKALQKRRQSHHA